MAHGDNWQKQLLIGVAVIVVVGVIVGGIVSVVALKAANVAGLTDDSTTSTSPRHTGIMPLPGVSTKKPTPSQGATTPPTSANTEGSAAPGTNDSDSTGPGGTTTSGSPTSDNPTEKNKKDNNKKNKNKKKEKKKGALHLTASPAEGSTWQRINLIGTWKGHDGATLQVQRSLDGGPWSNFPTDATVHDGKFGTYIQTGRTGTNRFRVIDSATGKVSNVVKVTIH